MCRCHILFVYDTAPCNLICQCASAAKVSEGQCARTSGSGSTLRLLQVTRLWHVQSHLQCLPRQFNKRFVTEGLLARRSERPVFGALQFVTYQSACAQKLVSILPTFRMADQHPTDSLQWHAGEQPAMTSRKLTLMNTHAQRSIKELSFQHSVLAVRMNRKR